jgi:hypothetical protein
MEPIGSLSCSQGSRHWSLSWVVGAQSAPSHPISLRSSLILFFPLRLGLPSGLFPTGFPTNIFYEFLISSMRTTCPVHPILLDLITLTIFDEKYKLWRSSLYSLLRPPATSSLLEVQIFSLAPCYHTNSLSVFIFALLHEACDNIELELQSVKVRKKLDNFVTLPTSVLMKRTLDP